MIIGNHQKVKLEELLYYVNLVLFGAVFTFTFVEIFTYQGFTLKHIYINPRIVFILYLLLQPIYLLVINKSKMAEHKRSHVGITNTALMLVITSILFYLLLSSIEKRNYPNYIFTKYHINFIQIGELAFVVGCFALTGFILKHASRLTFLNMKKKVLFEKNTDIFSFIFRMLPRKAGLVVGDALIIFVNFITVLFNFTILSLLLAYLYKNVLFMGSSYFNDILFMMKNINLSYEEKMRYRWDGFYDYMVFVASNVGENNSILHPPQINPWQEEGNQLLIRYFLYPRKLYSATIKKDLVDIDYIMIASGKKAYLSPDGNYLWPQEEINSEKVICFDLKRNEVSSIYVETIYHPGAYQNCEWGLIKVKK